MSRAKNAIKAGDVLGGKYRIERLIGQGGMGVVAAARHTDLHQRVAIKLLRPEHAKDPELAERFMREARAAARLRSEHAVKVVDVGKQSNGSPFIVMELLEGEDLGAVLDRTPLSVPDAVDFVLQACEAIAEAHALGIVHRDLKPRNLFLTRRVHGRALVKVLDFGLAKRVDVQDRALTATTAVMGSPQYMSPEQMKASRNVDFRTDIWSLGICLYELVSGRVPFDAEAVPVLCAMVLKDDPMPLRPLAPHAPEELWQVIRKCLSKDPSDRYTTISELAVALEPFAPPHARGAAERISTVLVSVSSEPTKEDTRIAATFDSEARRDRGSLTGWLAALGGVLVLLGVVGAVLIVQARNAKRSREALDARAGSSARASSSYESGARQLVVYGPQPNKDSGGSQASSSPPSTSRPSPALPPKPPASGKPGSPSGSKPQEKPEGRF